MFASQVGYALVNPSQVRYFAKGLGLNAKTDAIDAKLLLKYGQTRELQKQIRLSETETDLRSLSERRAQLSEMLAQEKNRLACATKRQRPSINNHITWLEEELLDLDEELKKLSAEEEEITQKIEIADTLPGIGPITAMQIIAHLPELGKIDSKSLAALVGVAPFNQDSGNFRGQRRCKGGRVRVRQALFLSTMGSLRCKASNPVKALYTRLVANGKKKMVAIVAAMHKQLTILNTMIRNGAHYDPVLAGFPPLTES